VKLPRDFQDVTCPINVGALVFRSVLSCEIAVASQVNHDVDFAAGPGYLGRVSQFVGLGNVSLNLLDLGCDRGTGDLWRTSGQGANSMLPLKALEEMSSDEARCSSDKEAFTTLWSRVPRHLSGYLCRSCH